MKIIKRTLWIALLINSIINLDAQVTIGSGTAPTRAALLDLKEKQTQNANTVADTESVTKGGLLLPRVKLVSTSTLEPFIPTTDEDWDGGIKEKELKLSLVGLMVYNVASVGTSLYPGLYTWDGTQWSTSQANPSAGMEISAQPKAFSFYETGEETAEALNFTVSGAIGVTYQWYQVTGSNVHVRVGTPIGRGTVAGTGATTSNFTPTGVIKGTTRNANNAGFYKFYCEATDSYGKTLQSNIAEVAVGCGAKDNAGEWYTFMCFNLGARDGITIDEQINYPITTYSLDPNNGTHTYVSGEEIVYGSLFQWGRIADGHESRTSMSTEFSNVPVSDIVNGKKCSTSDRARPSLQIAKSTSPAYGNFITTQTNDNHNNNWNPTTSQTNLNLLWLESRFIQNDPCSHYNVGGTYQDFWHEGPDNTNTGIEACSAGQTNWRTPSQGELSSLYRGNLLAGQTNSATANTWSRIGSYNTQDIDDIRGFALKPDGITTTLFLPLTGFRDANGKLKRLGTIGDYWSTTTDGTNSYYMQMGSTNFTPTGSGYRSYGMPLRCIKHT